MRFLLFGTGDYYERYKKWFPRETIEALLDNSPAKQNRLIDGVRVLSPGEGVKRPFDAVVILSFYVKAMRRQLKDLGVPESKIYHFYDLRQLLYRKERKRAIRYYGNAEAIVQSDKTPGKKILLLSQDMTLGGPAITLCHGAEILKRQGYEVVYASMLDGPLRARLSELGIPVIVDENLQIETMEDAEWTHRFSLLVCNTVNFHVFLSRRSTGLPVIWWLHDSEFFYDGIKGDVLRGMSRERLSVYSVGPVPERAIRKFIPDMPVKRLLYGVKDMQAYDGAPKERSGRPVRFVTIGYIEERKGQDLLIRAIRELPGECRGKARFCLVGQDSSLMAQRLRAEAETMPEVIMTGTVDRKRINEILHDADVLICPSREDPMPTVAAEAMMHSVPCIVSDAAGTAAYIRDGIDGFVFPSGDVRGLALKIRWCIEHGGQLHRMGIQSRRIYEEHFSMDVFEKELLRAVELAV